MDAFTVKILLSAGTLREADMRSYLWSKSMVAILNTHSDKAKNVVDIMEWKESVQKVLFAVSKIKRKISSEILMGKFHKICLYCYIKFPVNFLSVFLCYDIILLEFHSVCFNWNLTFYFDTSIWFSTISLSESESPVSKALYTRYMLDLWLNITYIKNLKKMHMLWNWKSVCEKLANDFGSDRCNCQMFEFKVTAYNKFITTRVCTGPVGRHRVYKL